MGGHECQYQFAQGLLLVSVLSIDHVCCLRSAEAVTVVVVGGVVVDHYGIIVFVGYETIVEVIVVLQSKDHILTEATDYLTAGRHDVIRPAGRHDVIWSASCNDISTVLLVDSEIFQIDVSGRVTISNTLKLAPVLHEGR